MTDLIGLKNNSIRAAAILTNAYVAGTILENCQKFNTLYINYDFTIGSLTNCQIKVEVSIDGTNYYELMSDSISSGVDTLSSLVYLLNATKKGSTTPLAIATKYIKISAVGTGTVTSSSLKLDAVLAKV